jgi:hypothetical protein
MLFTPFAARHPVFEQDPGHANGIEPLTDFSAFQIQRENVVATSRTNQHRSSGIKGRGGFINGQGGAPDVA